MATRREFLHMTIGAASLYATGVGAVSAEPARRPLDLLVLGGTGFLGPHEIEYALARGHRVTVFNRGRKSGLFGDRVEEIIGNRDATIDAGLEPLAGNRTWDAVIDNSGYVPRHVRDSVALLKDRVGRYLFVSTVAVYDFDAAQSFSESGPLATPPDPAMEEVTGETYGPLKAACDQAVRSALGADATIVRPTYIVGPGDTTDRFTYWVDRMQSGGEMLAPSGPDREIQWMDARDLCPWMITLLEQDAGGIFNAAGPASKVTREGLMWGLRATTAAPVDLFWPDDALMEELDISAPMLDWRRKSYHFDNTAAVAAGLPMRPLADTARDTLAWWRAQPAERRANPRRWIDPGLEQKAIARLKGQGRHPNP
jgi:2'-hydroxyisoflavone reductase